MSEANLPPLVRAMLQPGFYPHPVREPVELVQTHISYVLLAGEYAYKLKKSVDFGFLNFSTLEKRKHFCEEELRLNQRGAADLYLKVLPIAASGDGFQLAGDGEPVEYALKMKRFAPGSLGIDLLERGELTEEKMELLGQAAARYHADCPTNDRILSFGTVERVRESIDENYEQTETYVGRVQTRDRLEKTRAYTDSFFAQYPERFQRRIDGQKIRECHGDMHLKNICFEGDRVILFDCIEFNEPFRFVDFMYDVAFMVMDLEARDARGLANAFLNTYLEETGDWEGLEVLPLYLSRQAYVRAKVSSFLLDDPAIPEAVKKSSAEAAELYYQLSWEYTRSRSGRLILMSGLSGSGKSTVARHLARELGAAHLRSDAVRKHLAGVPLREKGGSEIYTPEMSAKTYGRLLDLGVQLAGQGWTVILDAKYDRRQWRQDAIARAQAANLPLTIYHCNAPEPVLRDRLDTRAGDIADATADLLATQQANAEPFAPEEEPFVRAIDTTQDIAAQL